MFDFTKMEIYHKNKKIANVYNIDGCFRCDCLDSKNPFNPFRFNNGELVSSEVILDFLKTRVFDFGRPDKKELLFSLGLDEYNELKIAKKTHGIILSDCIWIRFDDEKFCWEDAYEILYS